MNKNVQWLTLEEAAYFFSGGTPAKSNQRYWGGNIPWVSAKDMKRIRVSDTIDHITEDGLANGTRLAPAGATLVLVRGMTLLNDVPVCIAGREMAFNQDVKALVSRPGIFDKYLSYAVLAAKPEMQSAIDLAGHGTGRLPTDIFKSICIRIPKLYEQRKIAYILGTLDDKIELNRCMNETLEAMARAIFKSWFVDFDPVRAKMSGEASKSICHRLGLTPELLDLFPDRLQDSELGEIPDGWRVSILGEHIEIYDSKRIPLSVREREKRRGSYPYYGAASVMDFVDDYLFDGLYILMGEDGSVINDNGTPVTQYVWGKFWVNNHAHVLRAKSPMSNEHLLLLLQQTNITPFVTGAVQPKLSQGNLKRIPYVVAPDAINKAFGEVAAWLYSRKRAYDEEVSTLTALRDLLLPKLMSGEIVVEHLGEA